MFWASLIIAQSSASVFMPPSAEPGLRRWSRSARVFANASGATAPRAAFDYDSNYLANDFQAGYTRIVDNFHGSFTRQLQLSLLGRRENPAPR